jgi:hypothetical protein
MSKVKRITVSNLKAVAALTADFNGCTAIITGGNNKGKTSFLRGLFDRVRGIKPDVVLKHGEAEGFAECELTTGEKLKWEFNDKGKGFKEKLTYTTEKDIRYALTVELRNKFMPGIFDVDKFLTDQPAKQKKTLQQLAGIDFTDIDIRYKSAYEDREAKNRRANEERIILANIVVPENVEPVNMDDLMLRKAAVRNKLNTKYLENKKENEQLRKEWIRQCEELRTATEKHNIVRLVAVTAYAEVIDACTILESNGFKKDNNLSNFIIEMNGKILPEKQYQALPEPIYVEELPDDSELKLIDEEINSANENNRKAGEYASWLKQKEKTELHTKEASEAGAAVVRIETERMNLIKSAKLPDGFGFTDDGITYNGLSFTREQLSSSGIYIAALKLAAMTLGEVKTLHFDASFLDNVSLASIEEWAKSEDLQLLIEMPDRSGSNIQYELICNE